MSDYYESEIEPTTGVDLNKSKKKKPYKVKMKCKQCDYIGHEIKCPKCHNATFEYINPFGR